MLMMRDIYINFNLNLLTKFTTSTRNTKLKDIFPWSISQMIMNTVPISTRIVIGYMIKVSQSISQSVSFISPSLFWKIEVLFNIDLNVM